MCWLLFPLVYPEQLRLAHFRLPVWLQHAIHSKEQVHEPCWWDTQDQPEGPQFLVHFDALNTKMMFNYVAQNILTNELWPTCLLWNWWLKIIQVENKKNKPLFSIDSRVQIIFDAFGWLPQKKCLNVPIMYFGSKDFECWMQREQRGLE